QVRLIAPTPGPRSTPDRGPARLPARGKRPTTPPGSLDSTIGPTTKRGGNDVSGRHRGSGRRGISTSVIVLTVGIVLVVLATLGWFRLRDHTADQATAAAATCVEGNTVL